MKRRVVVTGAGVIAPNANGVADFDAVSLNRWRDGEGEKGRRGEGEKGRKCLSDRRSFLTRMGADRRIGAMKKSVRRDIA